MKPTALRPGDKVNVQSSLGEKSHVAFFVQREPAHTGTKAQCFFQFPDFVGLDGPTDNGICALSDYDVSRRVTLIQ